MLAARPAAPLLMLVSVVALNLVLASSGLAQVPVPTLEEMRGRLSPGDVISLVQTNGKSVNGKLVRFGDVDLNVRSDVNAPEQERDITVPLTAIQSLERKRDSTSDGTLIGAGVGAGFGLTLFAVAAAKDANEMDEWAAGYLAFGAVTTGIGALVGWLIDAANSKPHVKFDASPETRRIHVAPLVSADRRGIGITVSLARK